MPASRRTSASSHDEELAAHIQGLSLAGDRSTRASPIPAAVSASILLRGTGRFGDDEGARYASTYNAGLMLDEQLDQEMHSAYSRNASLERNNKVSMGYEDAMRNLPTSDDDKYHQYNGKVRELQSFLQQWSLTFQTQLTAANAALDLAHVSQTTSRNHYSNRVVDSREQSSEWPQFTGVPRGPDGTGRSERRNVTNPNHPNLTLSAPTDEVSKAAGMMSSSPIMQMGQGQSPLSRRGSPPNILDGMTVNSRSVPATPLGIPTSAAHMLKTSGSPLAADIQQVLNGRGTPNTHLNEEIQASLSRMPSAVPDPTSLAYNQITSARDDVSFYRFFSLPDN